jgi:hypothetical protein
MRFSSEQARLEHPQAGLIPQFLWKSEGYFNEELSDFQYGLMTHSRDAVDQLLNLRGTYPEELNSDVKRWSAWLALACANPAFEHLFVLNIGRSLGFSNVNIFYVTIMAGREQFLDFFAKDIGPREFGGLIARNQYSCFRMAAELRHVNVMKYFLEHAGVNVEAMISAREYGAFRFAAQQGHVEVINYLLVEFPDVFAYAMGEPLNQIMRALEPYVAGALGHEAIDKVKDKIPALEKCTNIIDLTKSLQAIQEQLLNLQRHQDTYFEGASPEHFRNVTDVLRYMCSGITALLSCIGVPQDRNLLAERMLNRAFFFQRPQTEEESAYIDTQLTQAWDYLALAIEKLPQPSDDAPEHDGPQP